MAILLNDVTIQMLYFRILIATGIAIRSARSRFSLADPGFGSRIGSSSAWRIPVSDPESDPGFGSRIEVKIRDARQRLQQVFSLFSRWFSFRPRSFRYSVLLLAFCFPPFVSLLFAFHFALFFSLFRQRPFRFCLASFPPFVLGSLRVSFRARAFRHSVRVLFAFCFAFPAFRFASSGFIPHPHFSSFGPRHFRLLFRVSRFSFSVFSCHSRPPFPPFVLRPFRHSFRVLFGFGNFGFASFRSTLKIKAQSRERGHLRRICYA